MDNQNIGESEITTVYFVDADDFCQDNSGLDVLREIKDKNPAFIITLFTIPGRCSKEWLEDIKKIDWIDMVAHGWTHPTPLEAQNWTYKESLEYLDRIEPLGLTKGFKAPGWQISDGMYRALLEREYWVADQHYNDQRRPKELKVVYPTEYHYHIGHLGGFNSNEIGFFKDQLTSLKGDFKFIKEI